MDIYRERERGIECGIEKGRGERQRDKQRKQDGERWTKGEIKERDVDRQRERKIGTETEREIERRG